MSTPVRNDYPALLNIRQYQVSTFTCPFTWVINGTPVNITGYSATFTVRASDGSTVSVASPTGITLGGAAGTVTVTISDDIMLTIPVGSHAYELVLVSGGGETTPLAAGNFVVFRV